MRRLLKLLAVSLLLSGLAFAGRPPTEFNLFLFLNGEPTRLGVLTSTGTSINNTTTASTFTITAGAVLKVICDAKAFITPGSTASASYTNANLGHPVLADTPYYLVLGASTTTLASISASGTTNCTVWQMQ